MISALPRRLNSSLLPAAEIRAVSCSLDESTTAVPKATMVLPPGVTMHMHELAELYVGQESHGYFRVVSAGAAIRNQTTVQLMGAADTLTDDIWAAEVSETSYDPDDLLRAALSHQSKAYWQAGNCDAAKAVKTAISYDDLWSVLEKIRAANPDCMWTYDYSTSPWTLSLVAMPDTVEAELRIGRNIESASVNITDKEMCNKLYMTVTTDSSSTLIVAENAESIAKYGTVIKKATVAAADAPNPQAYAEKILAERAEPLAYISISGLDLKAITGDDFDRIKLGSLCRAVIPEYGEGVLSERVVARKWPEIIHEPLRVTVSLANAVQTFQESLQFIRRTASSARSSASKTEKELTHWETIVTAQQTTLDDLGITGLWQSGLVLDAYQGVKIWSSEQGENSYLGQITINKNTIDQTVEAVGLVWDETANEGAGGWVPSSSPAAGSVAARLSLIPGQITAAASAVENNIKSEGYIKLQAAKDAAAAEIGAQLDNGTSSISAKVKALVEGDTSLIQLVAQQVDVVSELASYSGDIELRGTLYSDGGFDTTGDSKFEGNLVIDGGNLNLINGAALQIGGTAINPVNSISLVPPTGTSTTYTLKYTDLGGTEHTVGTFSRAASIQTVSGSWSGSTYQIVADASGTALPLNETLTFTVGTTPSGGASSTTIDRFSSLHKNTLTVKGSSQPSAAYIKQYIIDASGVYSDGETAGRTQAVTDATLSVDAPFVLNGVIKIYPRVTFDADTEKSANPMDAQFPALATNSSGTPTAAPSTLVAGSTVYPYVQIGSKNFFGSGYTVPSGGDGQSVDDITIRNNPVPASLVTIDGSRYVQGTANLTAWHNEEIGDDAYVPVDLKDDTAQVRMNIESILSSAESAALSGLNLSGWQLNSSSHDAENLVRDANNTTKFTVSLPPAANWDINVGAFNSSGSATIRIRPVLGGTIGTEVVTGTISDSNLKPENIKSGVTIFGKVGTYTGGNYTQATVTLQGEAENVYVPTPSGIAYYQAGTAVERYMGGSSFTVQGSKVSVTPVGTKYWYKWHPSTETPTSGWYSVHTSDPGGSFVIRYAAGTATDYYKAGTITKYERGASVSITPIKSTAMIQVAQEVRYKQGTTDSTTYYTRTSS